MAVQLLNYEENSLNLEKLKKKSNSRNSCLKSIWAIVFAIFIYVSIFYVFNLSPSSVVSTTKFWFVISNTLVLIIVADLNVFLKTNSDHDRFYHEYVKNHARTSYSAPAIPTLEKKAPKDREIDPEQLHEKVIDMDRCKNNSQTALEIYKPQISTTTCDLKNDGRRARDEDGIVKMEKKGKGLQEGLKCARSNSDKAILMAAVAENEERMVLQRTLSERHEAPPATVEENEFSNITNEELNRRVEEFIRRFNRQIRLQAARTRQTSSDLH